jgi:predicted transcriptional regulator
MGSKVSIQDIDQKASDFAKANFMKQLKEHCQNLERENKHYKEANANLKKENKELKDTMNQMIKEAWKLKQLVDKLREAIEEEEN